MSALLAIGGHERESVIERDAQWTTDVWQRADPISCAELFHWLGALLRLDWVLPRWFGTGRHVPKDSTSIVRLAGSDPARGTLASSFSDSCPCRIKGPVFGKLLARTPEPCAVLRSPAPRDLCSLSFALLAQTSLDCVSASTPQPDSQKDSTP